MIRRQPRRNIEDSSSSGALNDLSFLLIIFFIVIAGFNVNKGFLLNLPSKDKPIVVNTNDILKCELDESGALFLDGQEIKTGGSLCIGTLCTFPSKQDIQFTGRASFAAPGTGPLRRRTDKSATPVSYCLLPVAFCLNYG